MKLLGQTHLRIVTLDEERLKSVDKEDDKLNHLKFCEVPFPPEIRSYLNRNLNNKIVRFSDLLDFCAINE